MIKPRSAKFLLVDGSTILSTGRLIDPFRRPPVSWAMLPYSFLAFWSMGFGMLWIAVVPAVALWHFREKLRSSHRAPGHFLVALGTWLMLTLLAALLTNSAQPARVLGSAFAVTSWFGAGFLYLLLRGAAPKQLAEFIRGLFGVVCIQGLATLVAVVLHPSALSRVPLPSSVVLQGSNVAPWTTSRLAISSWFGETAIRSNGLMATAAWTGGFAALMVLMIVLNYGLLRNSGFSTRFLLATLAGSAISLYFSLSRLSWVLCVAGLATYGLFAFASRLSGKLGPLLGAAASILMLAPIFRFFDVASFVSEQNSLRPGSSVARFASYQEGFEAVTSAGVIVMTAGFGHKPFFEAQGRGIGSESTYVSLLVRGGLIAVMLFAGFLVTRLIQCVRERDWAAVVVLVALAIHAAPADLDVGTLTIILGVFSVGWLRKECQPGLDASS